MRRVRATLFPRVLRFEARRVLRFELDIDAGLQPARRALAEVPLFVTKMEGEQISIEIKF